MQASAVVGLLTNNFSTLQIFLLVKTPTKAEVRFIKNSYGVYAGADPNNPQKAYRFSGVGYDYYLPAIDATDQVAKDHDMNYDKVGAIGDKDFWSNPFTIEADKTAIFEWDKISQMADNDELDPINNREIEGGVFRSTTKKIFNHAINLKMNIAADLYL